MIPNRITLFAIGLLVLALPATGSGNISGQCSDCHTMHNSEQGQAVAKIGIGGSATTNTPVTNLLRMDCIACHAQNQGSKIVTLPGGSQVPQVYHNDTSDLAAGNFAYISGTKSGHESSYGNRKGHNVVDLVAADSEILYPPGHRHGEVESGDLYFDVSKFTCAGQKGCHGVRSQVLEAGDGSLGEENVWRIGLMAFSGFEGYSDSFRGAHHRNYDGLKLGRYHPDFVSDPLAHSYRFIPDLKGYGNEVDRWQNVDTISHNEYHGGWFNEITKNYDFGGSGANCAVCHQHGAGGTSSRIRILNRTMTGFCITCHGNFHSSGVTSGTSGAFLRHPSDYVIPDTGEYAGYTEYNTTAPVARPLAFFVENMSPSSQVSRGTDMVMCLSCHMAHASPYDGMLRFDYSQMVAGGFATNPGVGCLACHTTKGVAGD